MLKVDPPQIEKQIEPNSVVNICYRYKMCDEGERDRQPFYCS